MATSTYTVDLNGDGYYETIGTDANGDGLSETIGFDTDLNGVADTYFMDSNADGVFEASMVDLNGGGVDDGSTWATSTVGGNAGGGPYGLMNNPLYGVDPAFTETANEMMDDYNDMIFDILDDDDD